jgi:putative FmdB family regulatory protein
LEAFELELSPFNRDERRPLNVRSRPICGRADTLNRYHSDNRRVPIYEYRCEECRKRSSALLPSFSSPDPVCPHCGKPGLRRLVSTFATVRSGDDGGSGDGDDFGGGGDSGGGGDFDDGGDDYGGGDFDDGGDDY